MTTTQVLAATGRSRGGGGLPPTAIVLDIDGVIAPIGGSTLWGDDTVIGDHEDGEGDAVHLSPLMSAALDQLHRPGQVGCYWLTDWTRAMRQHIDLLPGRSWADVADPSDGQSRAGQGAGDGEGFSRWWKWRALDDWLRRHPEIQQVVWIDDRLHPDPVRPAEANIEPRPMWTGTGRLADRTNVLLMAPERRAGLTPDDLSTVADWIDTHTGTTSLGSRRGATGSPGPTLIDDAHPREGPGSDPQDLLPDDRAWGSRSHPPSRP